MIKKKARREEDSKNGNIFHQRPCSGVDLFLVAFAYSHGVKTSSLN